MKTAEDLRGDAGRRTEAMAGAEASQMLRVHVFQEATCPLIRMYVVSRAVGDCGLKTALA
jgi:hypothetical protein